MAIVSLLIIGVLENGLLPPRKIITLRRFINIMLEYSAIKKRAKGPPAYSTLYPETSSDSPSVRSNGARFVSASVDTIHIMKSEKYGIIIHHFFCISFMSFKENDFTHRSMESIINPILISYEIVWATARIPPIREYLDFEAHPDPISEYTDRLDSPKISNRESFIFKEVLGNGTNDHRIIAKVRNKNGEKKNRKGEAVEGFRVSFTNNFSASANGCRIP